MAFTEASVSVWTYEDDDTRYNEVTEINDVSEIKKLVDMNRSFAMGEVPAKYEYTVRLVRDDCEMTVEYNGPDDIDVYCSAYEYNADLTAKMAYKKDTGSLELRGLDVTFGAECGDKPLTDADISDPLSCLVAMFRLVGEIAPLVVADDVKPNYEVVCEVCSSKKTMTRKETDNKVAMFKESVAQRLESFDFIGKL